MHFSGSASDAQPHTMLIRKGGCAFACASPHSAVIAAIIIPNGVDTGNEMIDGGVGGWRIKRETESLE